MYTEILNRKSKNVERFDRIMNDSNWKIRVIVSAVLFLDGGTNSMRGTVLADWLDWKCSQCEPFILSEAKSSEHY